MNKVEKQEFLENGGTLLRTGVNTKGEHIIKQKTYERDWHIRIVVGSKQIGIETIQSLQENHPELFQIDQEIIKKEWHKPKVTKL